MAEISHPRQAMYFFARQTVSLKADNTARDYLRWLKLWSDQMGDKLLDPALEEAQDAFEQMCGHLAGSSQRAALGAIRWGYNQLREHGLTRNGVAENLHETKRAAPPKDGYPDADLDKLLATADDVDKLLVLFHADAGLRIAEILALNWSDVRESHSVFVDGRRIQLSERLERALHALPRKVGPIIPFRSGRRARERIVRLCKCTGVRYRGMDVLRRHAA